jgi:GDP-L-fucose synthase
VNKGFDILIQSRDELDLSRQNDVDTFFEKQRPDVVVIAAAVVGGILANRDNPYRFIGENLIIQNNLIDACQKYDTRKIIFLGSSCIYPKLAAQPLKEDYLLSGPLEETNQWYAIAKISGVKMIEALNKIGHNHVSLMPTNLYGFGDNFHEKSSHVIPGIITKINQAIKNEEEILRLWGTGKALREFLFVDDLAEAIFHAISQDLPGGLYNVGSGEEISIKSLAENIALKFNYKGKIIWDSNYPDGTPRKLLDSSKFNSTGWRSRTTLDEGLDLTIKWYKKNLNLIRNKSF